MVMRADFLSRVAQWACECFGEEIANNKETRNYRFLEEALELVQSLGCPKEDALKLVDYVYGRPVGVPHQELGGVLITLYALAAANELSPSEAGWEEYNRINTQEVVDRIRAKQKNKLNPLDVLPALEAQSLRHPDDQVVDDFAAAMRDKMSKARVKWGDDWYTTDPAKLQVMMTESMGKGNPVNVANYAMMLWFRATPTRIVYSSHTPKVTVQANFPKAVMPLVEQAVAADAAEPDETPYHMNRTGSVAVADDIHYLPMDSCPRGAKVLLLGQHGVATLGIFNGDPQWKGWFPLPKERKCTA